MTIQEAIEIFKKEYAWHYEHSQNNKFMEALQLLISTAERVEELEKAHAILQQDFAEKEIELLELKAIHNSLTRKEKG